jgi:hypothetical protein
MTKEYLEEDCHFVQGTFKVPEYAMLQLWDLQMYTPSPSFFGKTAKQHDKHILKKF